MYARLINNILYRAPKKLIIGDNAVYNPADEQYRNAGYKPVEYSEPPYDAPEGQHWEGAFVDGEEAITQEWTLVDDPPETDISPEEALDIILGGAET